MSASEEFERQYTALQNDQGWFYYADSGKISISGDDRYMWLQGMVSNDVMLLKNNKVDSLQACLLDATGHILSDMTITKIHEDDSALLLDLPRENVEKVLGILDRYLIMEDAELRNVTDEIGCVSIRGKREYFAPNTPEALAPLVSADDLVEISPEVQEVWRVEQGIPKYGAEMDQTVIASEAVGASHISLTKGCYVGQEIIARIDARGHTNRALTGMTIEGETLPKAGDKLFAQESDKLRETGRITSVVPSSPAADGKPIALGYVRHEHREPGSHVVTQTEAGQAVLSIAEFPFARKSAA